MLCCYLISSGTKPPAAESRGGLQRKWGGWKADLRAGSLSLSLSLTHTHTHTHTVSSDLVKTRSVSASTDIRVLSMGPGYSLPWVTERERAKVPEEHQWLGRPYSVFGHLPA